MLYLSNEIQVKMYETSLKMDYQMQKQWQSHCYRFGKISAHSIEHGALLRFDSIRQHWMKMVKTSSSQIQHPTFYRHVYGTIEKSPLLHTIYRQRIYIEFALNNCGSLLSEFKLYYYWKIFFLPVYISLHTK